MSLWENLPDFTTKEWVFRLRGAVNSSAEREEAERAARCVVDLFKVTNQLVVAQPDRSEIDDPVYEASLESFPASDPTEGKGKPASVGFLWQLC